MGTRSLLAYESKPGKYYVQYMQFDGYPSVKGQEYYEAIIEVLMDNPQYFIKNNKPTPKLFKRIKHFLDNYQYQSTHSINNHWTIDADKWHDQDAGQEWNYLFDKKGNFSFFGHDYTCTIPWEFTHALVTHFFSSDLKHYGKEKSPLQPFWDTLDQWYGNTCPLSFTLNVGKCFAFPDQGKEHGWRTYGILNIKDFPEDDDGNKHADIKIESMFSDRGPKRNEQTYKIKFESEWITVHDCSKRDLPLLIGAIKSEEALELFETRMKG